MDIVYNNKTFIIRIQVINSQIIIGLFLLKKHHIFYRGVLDVFDKCFCISIDVLLKI